MDRFQRFIGRFGPLPHNGPPPQYSTNSRSNQRVSTAHTIEESIDNNVPTGGYFSHARDFTINNPTMVDRVDHLEVHHYSSNVLRDMGSYVMPGAVFDSSDRDFAPHCHPGTRTRFLEELQTHIRDTSLGTRIIWLRGAAGIGKSAIMQTLAEALVEIKSPHVVFTTLFFSRPNKRNDPKRAFTTLAHGLAVLDSQYRRYVEEKLHVDPVFLAKSLEEQFRRLFLVPFIDGHIKVGSQRWVVMLDGLDECNGEREQRRIVDLVRDSILRHSKSTPFIWIIASRPEAHLKGPFDQVKEEIKGFYVLDVPMDSEESLRSVELYLRAEFAKTRRDYSDVVPPVWPSESDLLVLTTASKGLFIFASTLTGYVAEHNPVVRLRELIPLLARHGTTVVDLGKNPFAALDVLYTTIMSDISFDTLPTTKKILGYVLLGNSVTGKQSFRKTCNLLGLEQHTAYIALRKLHSVLRLPTPEEAALQNVEFLHASFSDFLRDQNRSGPYYIDLDQELTNIWRCCLKIFRESAASKLPQSISIAWGSEVDVRWSRIDLLSSVQMMMLKLLIGHYHDCTGCRIHQESTPRLSLSASELVEVFSAPDVLQNYTVDMGDLYAWSSGGHVPLAVSQRIIVRRFSLHRLSDQDVDSMFEGLCMKRWGYYSDLGGGTLEMNLRGIDKSQWDIIKQFAPIKGSDTLRYSEKSWEILGRLLHAARGGVEHPTQVLIIGTDPSRYHAVVGPLWQFTEIRFILIPYIESDSSVAPLE